MYTWQPHPQINMPITFIGPLTEAVLHNIVEAAQYSLKWDY